MSDEKSKTKLEEALKGLEEQRRARPEPSIESLFAYARGELTGVEAKALEEILRLRPDLRAEVEAIRNPDARLEAAAWRGYRRAEALRGAGPTTGSVSAGSPALTQERDQHQQAHDASQTHSAGGQTTGARRALESQRPDAHRRVRSGFPVWAGQAGKRNRRLFYSGTLSAAVALCFVAILWQPSPRGLDGDALPPGDLISGTIAWFDGTRAGQEEIQTFHSGDKLRLSLTPPPKKPFVVLIEVTRREVYFLHDVEAKPEQPWPVAFQVQGDGALNFFVALYLEAPYPAEKLKGVLAMEALRGELLSEVDATTRRARVERAFKHLETPGRSIDVSTLFQVLP